MEKNNLTQYVDFVHQMNKVIHNIDKCFDAPVISDEIFTNIKDLEAINREYNKYCKKIKSEATKLKDAGEIQEDKTSMYTEDSLKMMNKDTAFYRNVILNAKKLLIYFYNKLVYEIKGRYAVLCDRISRIDGADAASIVASIAVPDYTGVVISNYQDKVLLDFSELYDFTNKLELIEGKLAIPKEDGTLLELNYIKNYYLSYINNNINAYGVNKNITKTSIENDIFWVMYILQGIRTKDKDGNYAERCNALEKEINELKVKLVNKKVSKENNSENKDYFELKEKLELFIRELEDIHDRLTIRGETLSKKKLSDIEAQFEELKRKYDGLPFKITMDKMLCNNLFVGFRKIRELIKELVNLNISSKDETVSENDNDAPLNDTTEVKDNETKDEVYDKDYEVTGTRKGKGAYKKYPKVVLFSSAIATLSLSQIILPYVVPAIIAANIAVLYKYELADRINNILGKRIGAKKNKDGTWNNNLDEPITRISVLPGLMKSVVLNGEGKPNIVNNLVAKIKALANPSKARQEEPKKEPIKVDKKVLAELYKKYEKSGKRIREFCQDEKLPDEMAAVLIEYTCDIVSNSKGGRR